jgi:hypothetical protein
VFGVTSAELPGAGGNWSLPTEDDELLEALREENDLLRVRVGQLEETANEYRRQMASVLTSVSWRITSPLRMVAGRVRLTRRRLRSLPRRLVTRRTPRLAPTTGLFRPTPPASG